MSAAGHSHMAYGKFELRIVTVCAITGVMMQSLDATIANVALPYMQGSLAASRDQVTWVLTSYIVSTAIMMAPVGWLASRFGHKNLAIVSLAGFTIMSMMCGAAQTLDQMILFRVLQGVFGAALAPLAQAIMLDLYPPEKRGSIMAIFSMGIMVAPILGPTLGGYLTDVYSWRWVFYVNLPFGTAAVTGIALFFRDTHRDETLKVDWLGFSMLGIGVGAFQLMLDRGTSQDWFDSPEIIVEAVLAGLGFYLFFVHMFMSENTFIPREMFKDRNFASSLFLMFVLSFALYATTALLPPYLQNLGGYSVRETGLLMAPRGIGSLITMFIVGRIVMRVDPRHLMVLGMAVMLWATREMSLWTPDIAHSWLMEITFVQGLGSGLVFVPMNLTGYATLAPTYRTDGAAVLNLIRTIGQAIGISVTSTFLVSNAQIVHAQLAEYASPFNRNLAQNAPSMLLNPALRSGASMFNAIVDHNAQVIAYSNDFLLVCLVSLPALVVICMMRRPDLAPDPRDLEITE